MIDPDKFAAFCKEMDKMTEEEKLLWAHVLTGGPIEKLRVWRKIQIAENQEENTLL